MLAGRATGVSRSSCANGGYAVLLADLAKPPLGSNAGFISPDLKSDPTIKSGYAVARVARDGQGDFQGQHDARYMTTLEDAVTTARTLLTSPGRILLHNIDTERVRVPDREALVHLQFRRFAGCPVCNLHLRSFVERYPKITAASIREVIVFHSWQEEL